MSQERQPWASGPAEILLHGLNLLADDSDTNRRLAMLRDNAVELTIKTYLSLPRRITGLNISRSQFDRISESFPMLLDALERYSPEKIQGINLGDIEWYHRLRNQLYHQGNGLTVERRKVETYATIAGLLFKNLFDEDLMLPEKKFDDLTSNFLTAWSYFQKSVYAFYQKDVKSKKPFYFHLAINDLYKKTDLTKEDVSKIKGLLLIRNKLVHGERIDQTAGFGEDDVLYLRNLANKIKDWEEYLKKS